MSHLDTLNPFQREAAEHKDGPLLIIAGAGAGKTKTITHRILHLIEQGIAPERILAITFTNKAAKEMRDRVHILLNSTSPNPSFVKEGNLARNDNTKCRMTLKNTDKRIHYTRKVHWAEKVFTNSN